MSDKESEIIEPEMIAGNQETRAKDRDNAVKRVEELEAQLRFLVDNDCINDTSIEKEIETLLGT